MNDEKQARFITLCLAWERGYEGRTFATQDEWMTPGYTEAWRAGMARRDFENDTASRVFWMPTKGGK